MAKSSDKDIIKLIILAVGVLVIMGYAKVIYTVILILILAVTLILWYILFKHNQSPIDRKHNLRKRKIINNTKPAINKKTALEFHQPDRIQNDVIEPDRRKIDLSIETLKKIEWYSFELFCKIYFESIGYRVTKTKAGADGGIDLRIYQADVESPYALVQCKARTHKDVGIKYARELLGVMTSEKVKKGVLITNSCFTSETVEFSKNNQIETIDIYKLSSLLKELEAEKKLRFVEFLQLTDFTTPTCPNCEVKLVERTTKKGDNIGQKFWGCKNFPSGCHYQLKMNKIEN